MSRSQLGLRTRDRMLAKAQECYTEVKAELNFAERRVMESMDNEEANKEVDSLFKDWREIYDEFVDAELEVRRLLTRDELPRHDSEAESFAENCRMLVSKVKEYLANPGVCSSDSAEIYRRTVRETERLTSEIERLEMEIRNAREQTPAVSLGNNAEAGLPRSSLTVSNNEAQPSLNRNNNSQIPSGLAGRESALASGDGAGESAVGHGPVCPPEGWYARPPPPPPDDSLLMRMVQAMEKRSVSLPTLEPQVFEGNLMQFPAWWSTFEATVDQRSDLTDLQKLLYLGKYTGGPAKNTISLYLSLQHDPNAYRLAKGALSATYGDRVKISDEFRRKLEAWSPIRKGDAVGLQNFADYLRQVLGAMSSMSYLDSLNSREENRRLAQKLPLKLAESWDRIVHKWLYPHPGGGLFTTREATGQFPPFAEFVNFVSDEARIASTSCITRRVEPDRPDRGTSRSTGQTRKQHVMKTNLSIGGEKARSGTIKKTERRDRKCLACGAAHATINCEVFNAKDTEERRKFAREKAACFGCLVPGHRVSDCRNRDDSILNPGRKETEAKGVTSMQTLTGRTPAFSTLTVLVRVFHRDHPELGVTVCALLDTQSDCCFVPRDIGDELRGPRRPVKLDIFTLGNRCQVESMEYSGLMVENLVSGRVTPLPPCYGRDIPGNADMLPTPEKLKQWPHLERVCRELPDVPGNIEIGLLLGYNIPEAFDAEEKLSGAKGQPFALFTDLGWSVMGRLDGEEETIKALTFKTRAREVTMDDVSRAFDSEFVGPSCDRKRMSAEDAQFLRLMFEGLRIREHGRIELPLPFRQEPERVPKNRHLAVKRLMGQKPKFRKNPAYLGKYHRFITDLFVNDHAEEVPEDELDSDLAWYLFHHGVETEHKPDVVRVVHDPTGEYEGFSLNSSLLPGPDLMNNMTGVLLRFRREKVPLGCDIKAMFFQFLMSPQYRDFTRFVWFKDGKLDGELIDCRMKVHLFGATSSPGCANYALKHLAEMHREKYGDKVADFIRDEFYVDDGYTSVPDVDEAEALVKGSRALCLEGGINLQKFTTSNLELLQRIPESIRAPDLKEGIQELSQLPTGRTLGCGWNRGLDLLVYLLKLNKAQPTRRSMLSVLSSVFDPMGLIGPALLPGRRVLQTLCKNGVSWDDPVKGELWSTWSEWEMSLEALRSLEIQRCLRRTATLPLSAAELHTFTDASLDGYGAACYLVLRSPGGTDSSLVFAKSKVPPSKAVTVPRLELQAAVLGVRTAQFVAEELRYPGLKLYYWCDSTIVLGYILNDSKRFHIYVANRAQVIRDLSLPSQWRHVRSELNPADIASRGCDPSDLLHYPLWWHGPEFLLEEIPEHTVTTEPEEFLSETDPELRTVVSMATATYREASPVPADERDRDTKMDNGEDELELSKTEGRDLPLYDHPGMIGVSLAATARRRERFDSPIVAIGGSSDWQSMISTVAVWRRLINNSMARCYPLRYTHKEGPRDVQERKEAAEVLIRLTQNLAYPDTMSRMTSSEDPKPSAYRVRRNSPLYKFDVFKDRCGTLRIGGRIKRSKLPKDVAQPAVLPGNDPVSRAIIRHYHNSVRHAGRQATCSAVRAAGLWMTQLRSAVGSEVGRCVTCRRIRGAPGQAKMAELPAERVCETPPFTYCGTDYFGPMYIHPPRKSRQKRWGVLFTCMSMRAVHIEIVSSLSADGFLLAYRRMVGRRGPVRVLYSDRGTAYVGADNELKKALKEMNLSGLTQVLAREGCDLLEMRFIPPKSPHMGGVWERQVSTAKTVLQQVLRKYSDRLDDEELATAATECEAIVNDRPMTCLDSSSADAMIPLAPSQILHMKSKVVAPLPGIFTEDDIYGRCRWRKVQFLANEFWKQWRAEFLPTLQRRVKWQTAGQDVKAGDIVVIVDDDLPRSQWRMGRVEEEHPSQDGITRKVTVRTMTAVLERPINKVIVIYRPSGRVDVPS